MRLVTVTRVRNEDDLVEAFLRHSLRLADHAVILDDGSTDRTPAILAALREEGLPLTLLRAQSVTFAEAAHNTALYRRAAALGADWVLCLDCDEFIDVRELEAPLRETLAAVPSEQVAVEAAMVQYHPTAVDDAAEPVVPLRQRHREQAPSGVVKVFVRGAAARAGVTVSDGNHWAEFHGTPVPAVPVPGLHLAHYFQRSGWQVLAKAVVGRTKVLASAPGQIGQDTAGHYADLLAHLRAHPEWLLLNKEFLDGARPPEAIQGGLVHDPIDYLGGALRHTQPRDPRGHAAQSLLAFIELLATRHSRLLGLSGVAREAAAAWDGDIVEP